MAVTRITIAAAMIAGGLALIALHHHAAFELKQPVSIALVCLGALLDSSALAVLMWPAVVRRRPSPQQQAEVARRLDEIY